MSVPGDGNTKTRIDQIVSRYIAAKDIDQLIRYCEDTELLVV